MMKIGELICGFHLKVFCSMYPCHLNGCEYSLYYWLSKAIMLSKVTGKIVLPHSNHETSIRTSFETPELSNL